MFCFDGRNVNQVATGTRRMSRGAHTCRGRATLA
jgi:hypothetical protein